MQFRQGNSVVHRLGCHIYTTVYANDDLWLPFCQDCHVHPEGDPCYKLDNMARRWRRRVKPIRRPTAASKALFAARSAARLRLDQTAKGLGVHPRTVTRWENGETRPTSAEWSRLAAFFAQFAPRAAVELAEAAGVPSPFPAPTAVDLRGIEAAIVRAADRLDVAPRRVRAALRDIVAAVENARGSLGDLSKAAQDPEALVDGDATTHDGTQ